MSNISWGLVFPNVQKGQGCSTALVFHNRFHLQRLDVKYVLGGLCSQTFKRAKDALQPLCFTTVSISNVLMSFISWGLVFPNVQKGQGCSTALVFHNRFHPQHLDVSFFSGGLSSGTFKRVKDALQPSCFSTVLISSVLMSNISWGLVFPNVQKGQGCSTALVFLNRFHLQHLHNNVWASGKTNRQTAKLPAIFPL